MKIILSAIFVLSMMQVAASAQNAPKTAPEKNAEASAAERELKEFYDSYADDLRQGRREAIANRYDSRGYYSMGNGNKSFRTFQESKSRYMTNWTAPKRFAWKDLSFDVLSSTSAAAVGLFDFESANGQRSTYSYSASLIKQLGTWKIRVEDESLNTAGYTTTNISGDRNTPGPWKYSLTAHPGASIAAHRHTAAMKITVKSGRKFILMGDLDNTKVQRFEAGSTFVIPANTWHVEWWESETVEEIEMVAPTQTVRATPTMPRVP